MAVILVQAVGNIRNPRIFVHPVHLLNSLSQISDRIIRTGYKKQRQIFRDLFYILHLIVQQYRLHQAFVAVYGKQKSTARISIVCLDILHVLGKPAVGIILSI